jgi:hypothetical protein
MVADEPAPDSPPASGAEKSRPSLEDGAIAI